MVLCVLGAMGGVPWGQVLACGGLGAQGKVWGGLGERGHRRGVEGVVAVVNQKLLGAPLPCSTHSEKTNPPATKKKEIP